jgi:CHAD domain-containing protein
MHTAPASLAAHQIQILLSQFTRVRDGIPDAVHQARVSTRRLRELLPLVASETGQSLTHVRKLVRAAGRALGVVRELDTLMTLGEQLMQAYPVGASALAACRVELGAERERAARGLVKRLDRLDLESLEQEIQVRRFARWREAGNWRELITGRIGARAAKLERAIEHASGVYFPNRLHRVRIHLKKLRYAVEVAEQVSLWRPSHFRRDAGRLQDLLGDIHDRQVLLERIGFAQNDPGLRATIRADILMRHAEYLRRRDRLLAMIAACRRFANSTRHWRAALASGAAVALLLPAGVVLFGAHAETIDLDHGHVT